MRASSLAPSVPVCACIPLRTPPWRRRHNMHEITLPYPPTPPKKWVLPLSSLHFLPLSLSPFLPPFFLIWLASGTEGPFSSLPPSPSFLSWCLLLWMEEERRERGGEEGTVPSCHCRGERIIFSPLFHSSLSLSLFPPFPYARAPTTINHFCVCRPLPFLSPLLLSSLPSSVSVFRI